MNRWPGTPGSILGESKAGSGISSQWSRKHTQLQQQMLLVSPFLWRLAAAGRLACSVYAGAKYMNISVPFQPPDLE